MGCVNISSNEFKALAQRNGISESTLELITHKYWMETGNEESFPSDVYIQAQTGNAQYLEKGDAIIKLWDRKYKTPQEFKTLEELQTAQDEALKFFPPEALVHYRNSKSTFTLVVKEPVKKIRKSKSDFFKQDYPSPVKRNNPEFEDKAYDLNKAESLFNKYNTDRTSKYFADKVFSIAKMTGMTVLFNESLPATTLGRAQNNNTITFNKTFFESNANDADKARVILHEVLHQMTMYALSEQTRDWGNSKQLETFRREVNSLFQDVRNREELQGERGVRDIYEFMAELANPVFREKLRNMDQGNFWQRMLHTIMDFFGFKQDSRYYTRAFNALDNALNAFDIEAYMRYNGLRHLLRPGFSSINTATMTERQLRESVKSTAAFHASREMATMEETAMQPITEHEKQIEWVDQNRERLIEKYLKEFGNKFDPDKVRGLLAEIGYNNFNLAVYNKAGQYLRNFIRERMFSNLAKSKNKTVVILTGTPGSGKSFSTRQYSAEFGKKGLVLDSAFHTIEELQEVIDESRKAGAKDEDIQVFAIYNDLATAYKNSLNRGNNKEGEDFGRYLPIKYFVESFQKNQGKISALLDNNPNVRIVTIDNSNNQGREVSHDEARQWDYTVNEEQIENLVKLLLNDEQITESKREELVTEILNEGVSLQDLRGLAEISERDREYDNQGIRRLFRPEIRTAFGSQLGLESREDADQQAQKDTPQTPLQRANQLIDTMSEQQLRQTIDGIQQEAADYDLVNGIQSEVAKEMQEIKQKAIADGTFMKAPNGKPTNLTERQWLQVRTKPFKNWFGDWENPTIFTANNVDDVEALKAKYPSELPNKFYHHSTNKFGKQTFDSREGTKERLHIIGRLTTDKVDVLIVENPNSSNEVAHITLATAEGVRPVESNTEIQNNKDKIQPLDDYVDTTFTNNLDRNVSKVVDENGEPKVVYHGTNNDFTVFSYDHFGKTDGGNSGKGFYFAPTESRAKFFNSKNVMGVFLNIKNPFHDYSWGKNPISDSAWYGRSKEETIQILNNQLEYYKQEGASEEELAGMQKMVDDFISKADDIIGKLQNNDGIISYKKDGTVYEYVASSPNQIKSATENQGSFLNESDDIQMAIGSRQTQTFTFNDGTVVNAPFTPNTEQADALNQMDDFIKSPDETSMTLSGYAGTGKTSLMQMLAQKMNIMGRAIVFTATTNQAAQVLKTKVENQGFDAYTVNKAFGISVEVNAEEEYDAKNLVSVLKDSSLIHPGCVVVIDEASMINEEHYAILNDIAEMMGLKIIYTGDAGQLAPVKESKISKVFRDNANGRRIVRLTKVERTDDNAILKEATAVRNGEQLSKESSFNEEGKGVAYLESNNVGNIDKIIKHFAPGLRQDPNYFRILAFTNAAVAGYNKRMRQVLGYNSLIPNVGEPMAGYASWGYNGGKWRFINSGAYIVREVREPMIISDVIDDTPYEVQAVPITLENAMGEQDTFDFVDIVGNAMNRKVATELARLKKELWRKIKYTPSKREKANILSAIHQVDDLLFVNDNIIEGGKTLQSKVIDFGYALTVHKSQGSTFTNVLIDDVDISTARDDSEYSNDYQAVPDWAEEDDRPMNPDDLVMTEGEEVDAWEDDDTTTPGTESTVSGQDSEDAASMRRQLRYVAISRATDTATVITKGVRTEDSPLNHERTSKPVSQQNTQQTKQTAQNQAPLTSEQVWSEAEKIQSPQGRKEIPYTPPGQQRQTYTVEGNHIYNKEGKEVFKEDSKHRNKIFANLAVQEGRAVTVIHREKTYVVNNRKQIISVQTGEIMKWGEENGDRKVIIQLAEQKFRNKLQQRTQEEISRQVDSIIEDARRGITTELVSHLKTIEGVNVFGRKAMEQFLKNNNLAGLQQAVLSIDDEFLNNATEEQLRQTLNAIKQGRPAEEILQMMVVGRKGAISLDLAEEATTRMDNLSIANQMEKADKDALAIKIATGWERGADGKWRYEVGDLQITDDIAKQLTDNTILDYHYHDYQEDTNYSKKEFSDMLDNGFEPEPWIKKEYIPKSMKLIDLVKQNEAFEELINAYPTLKDLNVVIDSYNGPGIVSFSSEGNYDESTDTLTVNKNSPEKFISVLNHEIQHAIQKKEGFAKGGNSLQFENNLEVLKQKETVHETFKKLIEAQDKREKGIISQDEYFNIYKKLKEEEDRLNNLPFELYRRLAGEAESRTVEKRLRMTMEERRNSLFTDDLYKDVAKEDLIFLNENSEISKSIYGIDEHYLNNDYATERSLGQNGAQNFITDRQSLINELRQLKEQAENGNQSFTTPQGEVYGFVDKDGNIYLDEEVISPEHPLHEYTHLWDRVVAKKNPKLWRHGIQLMKKISLWNEIANDANYGAKWKQMNMAESKLEQLIASEVHARLVGEGGQAILDTIAQQKGAKRIIAKLKQWILDFWKNLKSTFSHFTDEEIDKITLKEFNQMTVRDFADAVSFTKAQNVSQSQQQANKVDISKISNKTAAFGVQVIEGSKALKTQYQQWQRNNPNGIVAYRVNFNHYDSDAEVQAGRVGNPFSENSFGPETVQMFYDWLTLGINPDPKAYPKATEQFRQAIINKILQTPNNAPILYYKEIGRPSHATVLGYLINNKNLLTPATQKGNQQRQQGSDSQNQSLNNSSAPAFTTSRGGYRDRTIENVSSSDVTISLFEKKSPGEILTENQARRQNKYVEEKGMTWNTDDVPGRVSQAVRTMPKTENITLNIAGNGIYDINATQEQVNNYLTEYLRELQKQGVTIKKVISGGQTGVDQAGIIAAQRLSIPSEVHAPSDFSFRGKDRKDVKGNEQAFKERFNQQQRQTPEQAKTINEELKKELGDSPQAESEIQDTVAVVKKGKSFEELLAEQPAFFSKEEIEQIKQALNGKKLQVISASRRTDPAFFSEQIVKFLEENAKKPLTDPTRVQAMEIWSKHDGLPIKNILDACKKYRVAPMVSFSITSLGDTALEKGVMKYKDMLKKVKALIDNGTLNPATTTIRIDPVLPGVTSMEDIKTIVQEAKKMGIKKFVTSLMQSYGYLDGTSKDRHVTSGIDKALASEGKTYDWDKYYGRDWKGRINFKPKQQYIDEIGKVLLELDKDPEITIQTCAFIINGLKASACLDPMIIEQLTGIDVLDKDGQYVKDETRKDCMCYGCHGDFFKTHPACDSSCAYCYAAHSEDSPFEYYNEDGTLKDIPLTQTENQTQQPGQQREMVSEEFYSKRQVQEFIEDQIRQWGYTKDDFQVSFEKGDEETDDIYTVTYPADSDAWLAQQEQEKQQQQESPAQLAPATVQRKSIPVELSGYEFFTEAAETTKVDADWKVPMLKELDSLFSMESSEEETNKIIKGISDILQAQSQEEAQQIFEEVRGKEMFDVSLPGYALFNNKWDNTDIQIDAKWKMPLLQNLDKQLDMTSSENNHNENILKQMNEIINAKSQDEFYGVENSETPETRKALEEYDRLIQQLDNLLDSDQISASEVRHVAELVVNSVSDEITALQNDWTLAKKHFPQFNNSEFDFQKASRREIVEAVGLNALIQRAKELFHPQKNNYKDTTTLMQAFLITDNWDAIMTLAADVFVANEGFGIQRNFEKGKFETTETDTINHDNFNEQQDTESIEETEGNEQEHWQVESRTRDIIASMTQAVRQAIHECFLKDRDGNVVMSKWGIPERVNAREAVNSILRWTQGSLSMRSMTEKLMAKSKKHPWLDGIMKKLNDQTGKDTVFQSQFYSTFSKYFQDYSVVIYDDKTKKFKSIPVNRNMARKEILNNMEALFKTEQHTLFKDNKGTIREDKLGTKETVTEEHDFNLHKALAELRQVENSLNHGQEFDQGMKQKAVDNIMGVCRLLGFNVTEELVNEAVDADTLMSPKAGDEGTYLGMISYLNFIVRSLDSELAKQKREKKADYDPMAFNKDNDNSLRNSISNFITPITDILEDTAINAFYDSGKMYQSYVTPSFLTKLMNKFKMEGQEFQDFVMREYGDSEWFRNQEDFDFYTRTWKGWRNVWLEMMMNSSIRRVFEHKVELNFNKKNYMRNMTPPEYTLSMLAEYFAENDMSPTEDGLAEAWFRIPMMSNKPSAEYIKFYSYRGDNYKTKITEGLYRMFLQEMSRIQTVRMRNLPKADDAFIKNFDKNGKKFCFLPFLNPYLEGKGDLITDDNGQVDSRLNSRLSSLINRKLEGKRLEKEEELELNDLTSKAIRNFMDFYTQRELDNWEKNGILKAAEKINNIGIKGEVSEGIVRKAAENFIWNDAFASKNILQLTITDIAFYKDTEDLQKRLAQLHAPGIRAKVDATDFLGNRVSDGIYRTLVLQDFDNFVAGIIDNINEVFDRKIAGARNEQQRKEYEELKNALTRPRTYKEDGSVDDEGGIYWNINVADAQGLLSPTAYRKKAFMFGKWTRRAEDVYQKLLKGEYTYSDLSVAFQPLKPFLYSQSMRDMGDSTPIRKMPVPFQAKNSEYLLIMADAIIRGEESVSGNMTRPNLLKAIYDVMEDSAYDGRTRDENGNIVNEGTYNGKGIDTVQFESAIKSGLGGAVSIHQYAEMERGDRAAYTYMMQKIYNSEVRHSDNYNKNIIKTLPFEDFSLQQEVPAHFNNHEQAHGSQIRAITPSDLEYFKDPAGNLNDVDNIVYYEWTEPDGTRKRLRADKFRQEYEQTIAENIDESIQNLYEELHLTSASKKEKNIALSKILLREIFSSPRYGVDLAQACSVDKETGEFRIPKGDPIQAKRIEQLINSVIKNRVNKQKIEGGPIVQVTNFGTSRHLNIRFKKKMMSQTEYEGRQKESPEKFTQPYEDYVKENENALLMTKDEYEAKQKEEPGNYKQSYQEYTKENQAGIAYFEVYLPAWSDLINNFMDKNGFIDIQAVEQVDPELLKMISYRIPTEDKYSTAPMKVVGFMPREAGDAIMLPWELTAIDGSDFDVDKRYVMRKKIPVIRRKPGQIKTDMLEKLEEDYRKSHGKKMGYDTRRKLADQIEMLMDRPELFRTGNAWEKSLYELYVKNAYSTRKPTEGRLYRNNKIIDMTWAVLTNETTADKILNPGGFDEPKKMGYMVAAYKNPVNKDISWKELQDMPVSQLKDLCYTEKDLTLIDTQVRFYRQNSAASSLIGVFAVHKVAHALLESNGIYMDVEEICGTRYFQIGSTIFGSREEEGETVIDGMMAVDPMYDTRGSIIGKKLAALVGASTDAVKDPVLNLMNVNMSTANILTTMIRLGMPFEEASMFLSQNVVERVLNRFNQKNLEDYVTLDDVISEAVQELNDKYQFSNSAIDREPVTMNELVQGLREPSTVETDMVAKEKRDAIDYKVLLALQRIKSMADAMRNLSFPTRFNSISSAVGPLIIDNLIIEHKMEKFSNTDNENPVPFYQRNYESGKIDVEYDITDIFDNHPMLESFAETVNVAKNLFYDMPAGSSGFRGIMDYLKGNKTLRPLAERFYNNRKLFGQLMDFYQSYLLIQSGMVNQTELEYYVNEFPKEFLKRDKDGNEIIKSKFPDNKLIQAIKLNVNKKTGRPVLYVKTTGMDAAEIEALKSGWIDLHKKDPQLSKKLFLYNFFRGGIGFNPKTFMNLLPVFVKERLSTTLEDGRVITYNDTYRNFPETVPEIVFEQFIRNNWNEKKLVPTKGGKGNKFLINMANGTLQVTDAGEMAELSNVPFMKTYSDKQVTLWKQVSVSEDVIEYHRILPLGNNNEYFEANIMSNFKPLEKTAVDAETDSENDVTASDIRETSASEAAGEEDGRTASKDNSQQIKTLDQFAEALMDYDKVTYKTKEDAMEEIEEAKKNLKNYAGFLQRVFESKGIEVSREKAKEIFKDLC